MGSMNIILPVAVGLLVLTVVYRSQIVLAAFPPTSYLCCDSSSNSFVLPAASQPDTDMTVEVSTHHITSYLPSIIV